MGQAKRKEQWEHTSALMALVSNILCGTKHKPSDFNPYNKQKDIVIEDLSILTGFGFTETTAQNNNNGGQQ